MDRGISFILEVIGKGHCDHMHFPFTSCPLAPPSIFSMNILVKLVVKLGLCSYKGELTAHPEACVLCNLRSPGSSLSHQVTKRDEDSSLMQLKEEFRTYEALRREHDSQIVQIAMEGGLRIAPDQWSSLLYGDQSHKSHMQSIIDKVSSRHRLWSVLSWLDIA